MGAEIFSRTSLKVALVNTLDTRRGFPAHIAYFERFRQSRSTALCSGDTSIENDSDQGRDGEKRHALQHVTDPKC